MSRMNFKWRQCIDNSDHSWLHFVTEVDVSAGLTLNGFWATVCKTVHPVLSVHCLFVCLSVCNVRALWPNGWMDQDETWHAGRPRSWPHSVRWGPGSPSPKGHSPAQFSAHICCGQMVAWIKMPLGRVLGLSPGDFMLDGDPAPPPQKGAEPPSQFSAHFYCGQMAGCIKNQDATWFAGRSQPRGLCVRWGPSPPKFSTRVYYSYCDFVRTSHNAQSLLVCSSSSASNLCILFLEKNV